MKFTMNFELMPSSRTILLMAASMVTSQGMVHGMLKRLAPGQVEEIKQPSTNVSPADNVMKSNEEVDSPSPEKGVCVKDACEEKPKQGTDTDHEVQTEATKPEPKATPEPKSSLERLDHATKTYIPAETSFSEEAGGAPYYPDRKPVNELGLNRLQDNNTMDTEKGWLCNECNTINDFHKWNPYSRTGNNTYYHKELTCRECGEKSDLLNRAIREECRQFREDVENLFQTATDTVQKMLHVETWVREFHDAARDANDEEKSRLKDDFLFWSRYDAFARGATEEQISDLESESMLEEYRSADNDDRKRFEQRIEFLIKFNKYMETATPNVKSKIAEFARLHKNEDKREEVEITLNRVIRNAEYQKFFKQFVTCGYPCVSTCGIPFCLSNLAAVCCLRDVFEESIGGCFERNPWLVAICRCTCSATEDACTIYECCVAMADCLNECSECCADCDCGDCGEF